MYGTSVGTVNGDLDHSDWSENEYRKVSHGALPDRYTKVNVPIEFETGVRGIPNGYAADYEDYGMGEGSYKTHAYVSMDDYNPQSSNHTKMDINGNDVTEPHAIESVSPDGTIIRQEVIPAHRYQPDLPPGGDRTFDKPHSGGVHRPVGTKLSKNVGTAY